MARRIPASNLQQSQLRFRHSLSGFQSECSDLLRVLSCRPDRENRIVRGKAESWQPLPRTGCAILEIPGFVTLQAQIHFLYRTEQRQERGFVITAQSPMYPEIKTPTGEARWWAFHFLCRRSFHPSCSVNRATPSTSIRDWLTVPHNEFMKVWQHDFRSRDSLRLYFRYCDSLGVFCALRE